MSNAKKCLIVFPLDNSTSFLEEIISYVFNCVSAELVDLINVEPHEKSHELAISQIQNSSSKLILFLGHGTSNSLHGALSANYRNDKFITSSNFQVFDQKQIMLVSCESSTLIKRIKNPAFKEAIGFGDLPTDWNDIRSAREYDVNAYKGVSESILETFKHYLVDIIRYSLVDFINESRFELTDLYNLILLRINKRIFNLYLKNKEENSPISDILFRMKHEMLHLVPYL